MTKKRHKKGLRKQRKTIRRGGGEGEEEGLDEERIKKAISENINGSLESKMKPFTKKYKEEVKKGSMRITTAGKELIPGVSDLFAIGDVVNWLLGNIVSARKLKKTLSSDIPATIEEKLDPKKLTEQLKLKYPEFKDLKPEQLEKIIDENKDEITKSTISSIRDDMKKVASSSFNEGVRDALPFGSLLENTSSFFSGKDLSEKQKEKIEEALKGEKPGIYDHTDPKLVGQSGRSDTVTDSGAVVVTNSGNKIGGSKKTACADRIIYSINRFKETKGGSY